MKNASWKHMMSTITMTILAAFFVVTVYIAGSFLLKSAQSSRTCFSVLDDVLKTRIEYESSSFTSSSFSQQSYEDEYINFVEYELDQQGDLINPRFLSIDKKYEKYQEDIELHQELWEHFQIIAPQQEEKKINDVVFFSDGKSGSIAYSYWHDETTITFGIDILDGRVQSKEVITEIYVHEIAHLITRWEDQFFITIYSDKPCTTFVPSYGRCSEPGAYITDFYALFWKDIYNEWEESNSSKEFYNQHLDNFINDYAATNIDEDMAETWSYFVLAQKPNGDTIPEQKVLFYYEYEELIELREELRNNICTYFDVPIEE